MLKYIKSSLKDSVIYGAGNLSTKLVGFILLPLYSTHLSIEEYGVLAMLEATSQILVILFSLSISQAFFRWYYEKEYLEKQKSLFFTVFIFLFALAILMVLSLYFFTGLFSKILFNNVDYAVVLKIMLVTTAMEIILLSPNLLLRLQGRPVLFTSSNIVKLVVSLLFTILFIVTFKQKLTGIYKAQLIGQLVYLGIISGFIIKNIDRRFNKKALYEMLVFSIPFVFSSFAALAINMSDRFILSYFGTFKDVGQYSLGYKISNTIYIFVVASVNMAVTPMIFKMMNSPNKMRFYSKLMTYYTFGLMFCVLAMSFFGKEIIKVLAHNPSYWNSFSVVPFISFSIIFMMLKDISLIGLQIIKKTRIIAVIVIAISIFNVLSNILFISWLGTIGAAVSALVSQIVYFTIAYLWSQKLYHIPYEIKKVLLMVFLGAALYLITPFINDSSLIVRLTVKSVLIISFPVLLYFLRFYETVEILTIRNFWKKWNNPFLWSRNFKEFFR